MKFCPICEMHMKRKGDFWECKNCNKQQNSFGGYPIGFTIGLIVLPLSVSWIQKDPYTVNILITLVYASVSFVRIYFLRRLFVRIGFDDNFIRLGRKVVLHFVKVTKRR